MSQAAKTWLQFWSELTVLWSVVFRILSVRSAVTKDRAGGLDCSRQMAIYVATCPAARGHGVLLGHRAWSLGPHTRHPHTGWSGAHQV